METLASMDGLWSFCPISLPPILIRELFLLINFIGLFSVRFPRVSMSFMDVFFG